MNTKSGYIIPLKAGTGIAMQPSLNVQEQSNASDHCVDTGIAMQAALNVQEQSNDSDHCVDTGIAMQVVSGSSYPYRTQV